MRVTGWLVEGLTSLLTAIFLVGCGGTDAVENDEAETAEVAAASEEVSPPARAEPSQREAEPIEDNETDGPTQREETTAARTSETREEPRRAETAGSSERRSQRTSSSEDERRARQSSAEARESSRAMEPEIVDRDGITLNRVVMARDIEDRSPVDESTSFRRSDGERIYAYLDVANPERKEQELTVAWLRSDRPDNVVTQVAVNVGPHPRWRTWAYTSRLRRPGQYMVEVRDSDNALIARAPFEVVQ